MARRMTYIYQNALTGYISNAALIIYCLPSLARHPMFILIWYFCFLINFSMYTMFLYESLDVSVTILAFFACFAWCVGFVMDPIIGYLSDQAENSFGRRRIFLTIGAIIYPAFTILLFTPPSNLSNTGYYWWYGFFFSLFFVAYSIRYSFY